MPVLSLPKETIRVLNSKNKNLRVTQSSPSHRECYIRSPFPWTSSGQATSALKMTKNIQFVILSDSEGSGCFLITILLQRTPLEGLIQRSYCEEGERWFTPLLFKGRGIEYMDYANRGDRFVILRIDSRAFPETA